METNRHTTRTVIDGVACFVFGCVDMVYRVAQYTRQQWLRPESDNVLRDKSMVRIDRQLPVA